MTQLTKTRFAAILLMHEEFSATISTDMVSLPTRKHFAPESSDKIKGTEVNPNPMARIF